MHFLYLLAAFIFTATPTLASDTTVSIRIGQPGFYGELHFGGYYPSPLLIYPQPVLIWQTPTNLLQPPIYLHVPPGHAKNWNKFCHLYNACHRNVYFVQENWYNNVYIPYYQKRSSYWGRNDNKHPHFPQNYPRGRVDRDHDKHKDFRDRPDKDRRKD